jgi:anti-sigma regulatory factor (Ser/Thr protein kinase)
VPYKNSLIVPSSLLSVCDESSIGEVRRFSRSAAESVGLDETVAGKVSIVATEMASNLVRHAKDGLVVVRASEDVGAGSIELLALDRGPGMRDVARCMEDGYSTAAGGTGTGLGAIRRLSDEFDIHSVPDVGTAVLARFWKAPCSRGAFVVGALSLPYPGEQVCGDAWDVLLGQESCSIAVIDGLGHGVDAGLAAREAVRSVESNPQRSLEQILGSAHLALRHTRGAAMAVAEVRAGSGLVRYAGVGNIVGATASPDALKRMVSLDGTVGHELHRIREFEYLLEPGQILVMHSDGLRSQWRFDRYPGLLARDPLLIAGVLYRDYAKGNDDVTVVVVRAVAA